MTEQLVPGSRRALLAGGLGGVAAAVLAVFGRSGQVAGANGDAVKLGQGNAASNLTAVNSAANGFKGKATGAGGVGLIGESTSATGVGVSGFNSASGGIGVRGSAGGSGAVGVFGIGPRGVVGETQGTLGIGVVARASATTGTGTGLRALALSPAATAVYAENSGDGGGGKALHATSSTDTAALIENVQGTTNGTGLVVTSTGTGIDAEGRIGVLGSANLVADTFSAGVRGTANKAAHFGGSFTNTSGMAIEIEGGLRIQRAAGIATIGAGQSSVQVTPEAPVRANSFVLATLQSNAGAGIAVERVAVGANNFTIHLTGNAASQSKVAWLIVN